MSFFPHKLRKAAPYFLTVVAITLPWFFHRGFLFFTDSVWGPHLDLSWQEPIFLFNLVFKFFSFFLPLESIQKIFIALVCAGVLLGGKKIAEYFLTDTKLIFLVALFTLFNPFIYDRLLYGQVPFVLAFGFLCFGLGFFLEYLQKRGAKQVWLASIFFGLSCQLAPHFIFFVTFLCGVFFFFLFCEKKKKRIILLKYIGILALCLLLLNLHWIIASITHQGDLIHRIENEFSRDDLVAFQTSGKNSFDVVKNLFFLSGFWGKDQGRYVDLTQFQALWGKSFCILFPLIVYGAWVGWKNKTGESRIKRNLTLALSFIFIVSLLLATGIRVPMVKELNLWLFDHFPFYKGFREPQKWVSLMLIVYICFFSMGLGHFFAKEKIKKSGLVLKIFLGGVIIMQAPFLLWGFFGQVRPTQYPADWYRIDEYLVATEHTTENSCQAPVLFLPWHLYMSFGWIGNIVSNPAEVFFTCPTLIGTDMEWGNTKNQDPFNQAVAAWMSAQGKTDFLQNSYHPFKYILVAKELDWVKYNFLERDAHVKLIQETATLRLYENFSYPQ